MRSFTKNLNKCVEARFLPDGIVIIRSGTSMNAIVADKTRVVIVVAVATLLPRRGGQFCISLLKKDMKIFVVS